MIVNQPKDQAIQTDAPTGGSPAAGQGGAAQTKQLGLQRQRLDDLPMSEELRIAVRTTCQHLHLETVEEQHRVAEEFKLQYYYGGRDVACLDTSAGRLILAVGTPVIENLPEVLQCLQPDERCQLSILSPEPWGAHTVSAPALFSHET